MPDLRLTELEQVGELSLRQIELLTQDLLSGQVRANSLL